MFKNSSDDRKDNNTCNRSTDIDDIIYIDDESEDLTAYTVNIDGLTYFHKKNIMYTYKPDEDIYIFRMDIKKFISFISYKSFSDNIDKLRNKDGNLYIMEIIKKGRPLKPILDIEQYGLTKKELYTQKQEYIKNLVDDLIYIFIDRYNIPLEKNDIKICDASGLYNGSYKLSLHITITPGEYSVTFDTLSKKENNSAYAIHNQLLDINTQLYKPIIDPSIYASEHSFRIVGSCKTPADKRELKPISSIYPYEILTDYNISDYLITHRDMNKKNQSLKNIIYKTIPAIKTYNINKDSPHPSDIVDEYILKLVKKHHPTAYFDGLYNDVFYNFNYKNKNETCPISGLCHDSLGVYVVERDTGIYLYCRSEKCRHKKECLNNECSRCKENDLKCVRSLLIGYDDELGFLKDAFKINQRYITDHKLNDLYISVLDKKIKELKQHLQEPIPYLTNTINNNMNKPPVPSIDYTKNYKTSVRIPYSEQLKHIDNINNYMMDLVEEATEIYELCKPDNIYKNKQTIRNNINEYLKILDDAIKQHREDNKRDHMDYIFKWVSSEMYKTLMIRSPMDTGKTQTIKKIIVILEYLKGSALRVCWITHRRSLSNNLINTFKHYGFINYLDIPGGLSTYDKVIISLDSIMRLGHNKYDLIIFDEYESICSHYSSTTMKNPKYIYNITSNIINGSKKILILDADIGHRGYMNMKTYGTYKIIHNTYQHDQKEFIITNNEEDHQTRIYNDIAQNLNICIVSMSAGHITQTYERIKKKFKNIKILLITSKTSDNKELLKNVNDEWIKYQVVLYSPSIDAGVDFNMKHFTRLYGVLKSGAGTASPRTFIQMTGRIRHLEDHRILCYYNITRSKIHINSYLYTVEDLFAYYMKYNNYVKYSNVLDFTHIDDNDGQLKGLETLDPYYYMQLCNMAESLNKHKTTFITVLNKSLLQKGYTLTINSEEKGTPAEGVTVSSKEETILKWLKIIDSNESYDFSLIFEKVRQGELTADEKIINSLYWFIRTWGITDFKTTDETTNNENINKSYESLLKIANDQRLKVDPSYILFFSLCYGKNNLLNNYYLLFHDGMMSGYDDTLDDDTKKARFKELRDQDNKTRKYIIFDMLQRLTGRSVIKNADDISTTMTQDERDERIKDILNNSKYFTDQISTRKLFNKTKINKNINYKFETPAEKKQIFNMIQLILKDFNIIFNQGKRIRTGKTLTYNYVISVDPLIKNIYEYKNVDECLTVEGFELLFPNKNEEIRQHPFFNEPNPKIYEPPHPVYKKNPFKKRLIRDD